MSTIEEKFREAKREILGEPPQNSNDKIVYERARVQFEDYIKLFEKTLHDPAAAKANASVLFVHYANIEFGTHKGSEELEKIERDMNSTIYSDARKRFVDFYRGKVPTPSY